MIDAYNSIEIINLRNEKPKYPYDVRIDRGHSKLSNPNILYNESERNDNLECYSDRLSNIINNPDENIVNILIIEALIDLIHIWQEHGKLRMFCWCAPKYCHGDIIKDNILMLEHAADNYRGEDEDE